MSTTEERIAAAFAATAGGITMETSTLEKRFAEVRDRGVAERRRRKGLALGVAALATAAAVAAAFALGGGLPGDDDRAIPRIAEQPVFEDAEPATGEGFPLEGTTYVAKDTVLPFSFTVPAKGEVFGKWHYGVGEVVSGINLDNSPSTGHAMVEVMRLEQTYDPARVWSEQTALVPAPQDVDGWLAWLAATGRAEVSAREELEVDGRPATRVQVSVEELPAEYRGALALHPIGPGTPGQGPQSGLPWTSHLEVTFIEVDGRTVLAVASGAPDTKDAWLPLMRSLVDSLRFA